MRRVDVPYEDKELIKLLKEDPIGRRADVEGFLHTLESVEGGFTFFLDEAWGEGKTVFSRQIEICLRELNPIICDGETGDEILKLMNVSEDSELRSYLPVYYNAWENDYWDDPLPSLGSAIAAAADAAFSTREERETGEVAAAALDAVLKSVSIGGFLNLGGLADARQELRGSDLIEGYKNRGQLRQEVDGLINASLPEHANKMLLIIDELDRCRPVFALRALEEIKNLFTSDKLVILCSVNTGQLAKTVEGTYGSGTDGDRYLERFCDARIGLSPASRTTFMAYKGLRDTSYFYDSISIEVLSELMPPLRTLAKVTEELNSKRDAAMGSDNNETPMAFAAGCLVPILIILKHCLPDEFRSIQSGASAERVVELVNSSESATTFFDRLYGRLEELRAIERAAEKEAYEAAYEVQKQGLIEGMVARIAAGKEKEWPEGCEKITERCWVEKWHWKALGQLVSR